MKELGRQKSGNEYSAMVQKFVENIVQAVSKFVCFALQRVHDEGFRIVMHTLMKWY